MIANRKLLALLGGLVVLIILGLQFNIFPKKIITSSYKEYRVTVYQHNNHLKLQYFSHNFLDLEQEMLIEEKLTKENIIIEWVEDTVDGNFGELYPEISLTVSVITNKNERVPFFERKIYDLTKPIYK